MEKQYCKECITEITFKNYDGYCYECFCKTHIDQEIAALNKELNKHEKECCIQYVSFN